MQTVDLLKLAAKERASDVHVVPGSVPLFRIDGLLHPAASCALLSAEKTEEMILSLLTVPQKARLSQESTVDFSLNVDDMRYRGNVVFQRNGLEAIFRLIPTKIPTPEDLQLPPIITELANLKSGLVLVTGPTGAGKSTTLACLLDQINQRRHGNIITIEDPIEFIHANKNCVVSQREVGIHTPTFSGAMRSVMRQDPDVVMVGEMRDLETIAAAITVAETGHLVLATLHSVDAAQAVDRIVDVFPGHQQQQIRIQLSGVLRAVIAQTLLPLAKGRGRVAVREIMLVTSGIANLIRSGKNHEIYAAIEMGAREGMISLGRATAELVKKGLVEPPDVAAFSNAQPSAGPRRRATDFPAAA